MSTQTSCSFGDCNRSCVVASVAAESDRNTNFRNYESAEQMESPDCCIHCGGEDIDLTHFEIEQDGNKISWIEDYQCGSCFEPQFREITRFTCPNLLNTGQL